MTIIAFLAVLIFFGFAFNFFSYGINLDQKSEQKILFSNIKSYLKIFGCEDGLFYSELENDGIICIEDNIDKYNGMAVFYPAFFVYFINRTSPYAGMLVWQSYIFLIYSLGLVSLFFLLRSLFSDISTAYLGTLIYYLTPRFFAECHYNNKDIVQLSLLFCILLCGWKIYEKLSWKWVILFSVVGAFASNMKIIGMFTWCGTGLVVIFFLLMNKRLKPADFIKIFSSLILFVLVYMCITPACRSGLFTFWRFLIASAQNFWWNDYVLFKGALYNKEITGIPRAYLPTLMFITIPVGIIILFIAGLLLSAFDLIKHPSKIITETGYMFAGFGLSFLPLLYAVYSKTPVYNGWRHFYFSYAGIILIVSYCIDRLLDVFRKKKNIIVSVIGIYLLFLFTGILLNHPYEYSYFNVLSGENIETVYELDYWDMSFKQAYEYLLKNTDADSFTVASLSNPGKWGLENQYFAIRGRERNPIQFCEDWHEADYLIINPTYAFMYAGPDYEYVKNEYELIKEIDSYGNVICEIYKKQKASE